jgi:soluble lytic murein transglycosylase-like protein
VVVDSTGSARHSQVVESSFVSSGTENGMTLKTTHSNWLRALLLPTCLLAVLLANFSPCVHAAESISAYVDADGRVIFVNGDFEPRNSRSAAASANSAASRKVLASTSRVAMAAVSRSMAAASSGSLASPSAATPPADLNAMIDQEAAQHQIDPALVRAIIRVESNFNPYAVSSAGAQGLMQLVPATAERFGVANPFDPRANLDGGIRYLKYLLGMYGGDLHLTLAAYNAGETSVTRSQGVPSYQETRNYLRKIGALYPIGNALDGFRPAPKIMKFVDAAGVVHFSNTDVP